MYAFDEVSVTRTMRVAHIVLTPGLTSSPVRSVETRSDVGLWQMTEEKVEWAGRIYAQLLELRDGLGRTPSYQEVFPIFYKNREWVNDDTLLVQRASEIASGISKRTLVLVSTDKRLARRMSQTTGLFVGMVSPYEVIINNLHKPISSQTVYTLSEVLNTSYSREDVLVGFPPVWPEILVDTGGLAAAAQMFDRVPDERRVSEIRFARLQRCGVDPDTDMRFETIRYEKIPGRRRIRVSVYAPNTQERVARVRTTDEEDLRTASLVERSRIAVKRFMKG